METSSPTDIPIFLGAKFFSSDELKLKLKQFEDCTKCSFVIKNSTRAETDNKKRKRPIPAEKFELARGTVVCAHFGARKRDSNNKGVKSFTKSQKLECGAFFSFTFDDFKQCLIVTKCNLVHNHETNERTYAQQHKQKQFTEQEKTVLKEVVALNPDNEKLLVMVQKDFQKSLCLRDIRMLKHKLRLDSGNGSNAASISHQLQTIQDMGGDIKLVLSTDGEPVNGEQQHLIDMIAFSTKEMIACYKSFPECIFIDGTYKKNSSGYPLYQIMVEDCLGSARPVFYAFIRNENISILTMVLQTFADFVGDAVQSTKVVMTDKCSSETAAIKKVLPWARHLFCHWHVYSAFERKVKNLTADRKTKQQLTHIHIKMKDEVDMLKFKQLEAEIENLCPEFHTYYCQQWRSCRSQWAACDRLDVQNYLNDTNNFVESENCRLGKLLSSSKSLASALRQLLHHAVVQMNELAQLLVKDSVSTITYLSATDSFLPLYSRFFSHAVKHMIKNHKFVNSYSVEDANPNTYLVTETSGARFKVTVDDDNLATCHCPFMLQMNLPCGHMMACFLRGMKAELHQLENRWLRNRKYVAPVVQQVSSAEVRECAPPERRHYQTEALFTMLANLMKNCGGDQYQRRLQAMKRVLAIWEDGKEVAVAEVDNSGAPTANDTNIITEGYNRSDVTACGEVVVAKECDGADDIIYCVSTANVIESNSGDTVTAEVSGGSFEVDISCAAEQDVLSGEGKQVAANDIDTFVLEQNELEVGVSTESAVCDNTDGVANDLIEDDLNSDIVTRNQVLHINNMCCNDEPNGAAVVDIQKGKKKQVSFELSETSNLSISIPTIRPRGRPAKTQTKKKAKKARSVFINENICHLCLKVEIDKSKSDSSGFDDWTRCVKCVRWYHDVCIEEAGSEKTNYTCKYHSSLNGRF